MNLNDNNKFREIWLTYAITAIRFDKKDLQCPVCKKVSKHTVMAFYKHIVNHHKDSLSRENAKQILIEKFSQINPPRPKKNQEVVAY